MEQDELQRKIEEMRLEISTYREGKESTTKNTHNKQKHNFKKKE